MLIVVVLNCDLCTVEIESLLVGRQSKSVDAARATRQVWGSEDSSIHRVITVDRIVERSHIQASQVTFITLRLVISRPSGWDDSTV